MKFKNFAALLVLCGSAFAETDFTMEDLKKLAASGRNREILLSSDKVKPTARTKEWEDIVAKATKAHVDEVATNEDREWAFEMGKNIVTYNPHLEKDKELMYKLGSLASGIFSSKGTAAPYYAAGLEKNDKRCSEKTVQVSAADAFNRSGFEKEKTAAKKIVFDLCATQVSEDWAKSMVDTDYALTDACPGLLKLGKITGVRKAKCENFAKGKK